jgi:hypothetical protein
MRLASVVDQDVDGTSLITRLRERSFDLSVVRDIRHHDPVPGRSPTQLGTTFLQRCFVSPQQGDCGVLIGKRARNGCTDTPGGTGHEHVFASKHQAA